MILNNNITIILHNIKKKFQVFQYTNFASEFESVQCMTEVEFILNVSTKFKHT